MLIGLRFLLIIFQASSSPIYTTTTSPSSPTSLADYIVTTMVLDNNEISVNQTYAVLEVRDVCYTSGSFLCNRALPTDQYYNQDLLATYQYVNMSGTGTLIGNYKFPLPGFYSVSVIILEPGILAEYWDNIWFTGSSETQIHTHFNITFEGLITKNATEFISARYFTFLSSLYTEVYNFSLTVDDNARLYIDGHLVIDAWNTSLNENNADFFLNSSKYHYVELEYRQLQKEAHIILYWSSNSQGREIIPYKYFLWPTRADGSPWIQAVSQGISYVERCYFDLNNPISVGSPTIIDFYSVGTNGKLIDNPLDIYTVEFLDYAYYVSTYIANGHSQLEFTILKAKDFIVSIKLYNQHIKNSPFVLTTYPGKISPLETKILLDVNSAFTVGYYYTISINPCDQYKNKLSSIDGLSVILSLQNTIPSAISVENPKDWFTTYSSYYVEFLVLAIKIKVYIAGTYSINFLINAVPVVGFPSLIQFIPLSIMLEHSAITYNSLSITAGDSFIALIQARDIFYNNIIEDLLITSSSFISGNIIGSVSESKGIIKATILLTTAGLNYLKLMINNTKISLPNVYISPSSLVSPLNSKLITYTKSMTSGQQIFAIVETMDIYSNLRYNSDDQIIAMLNTENVALVNNMNGTYSIFVSSYISGASSLSVTINSIHIQGSPSEVNVLNSNISGYNSEVVINSPVTAGMVHFTIISRDFGNNLINNPVRSILMGKQYYTISIQGPQNALKNVSYIDYSGYSLSLPEITKAGQYNAVLGLFESLGLLGYYYADNNFQILYKVYSNNYFPQTQPSHYTQKDPVIAFDWSDNNPIINSISLPDFFSAKWIGKIYITYSELYNFTIDCDFQVRLNISGTTIIDSITIGRLSNNLFGVIQLNGSSFYDISVEYKNGGSSGYITLLYSSLSEPIKIVPSSNLYALINSYQSPNLFTVLPASTYPLACKITTGDSNPLNITYAGTEKLFFITAYDAYGNIQTTTDYFFATISSPDYISITGENGVYVGRAIVSAVGAYRIIVYAKLSGRTNQLVKSFILNAL